MASSRIPPAKAVRVIEAARYFLSRLHARTFPAPAVLMEMVMNAWVAQAITAAADLGIADALADGPLSAQELAVAVDADADALARLLRALISRGIFRQRRDGRYELTRLAQPLRRDADVSLAAWARWMGSPENRDHWSHLSESLRLGECVACQARGQSLFEFLAGRPELQEVFNQAMTGVSEISIAPLVAAYDFTPYATIVDVGGGRGRLLAAMLTAAPRARGVLFDQPHVVIDAPAELRKHRVLDRVRIAEGSFFDDDIPAGGDAYVLKNVIHDWPDEQAVRILSNVRASSGAGKHLLLVELVIPAHRREFAGKWLDLEMFVSATSRERTADEYGRLLARSGFQLNRVVETVSPFSVVEAIAV
ncbi:hydroxyneurosporene methyltransferase [Mycobacterium sp. IEC1808]|uniref:methyltransferase n=1 Tax=Mycobacterium sp. IEC1808 TaxID=1743230 RepID=UPI000A168496|nr:methyltransferase [Mycobacterium sp. IEC1808]ORW91647.1 hydroxyneurosporene methyltransferase [Mycobacterium sp. IEC1808]